MVKTGKRLLCSESRNKINSRRNIKLPLKKIHRSLFIIYCDLTIKFIVSINLNIDQANEYRGQVIFTPYSLNCCIILNLSSISFCLNCNILRWWWLKTSTRYKIRILIQAWQKLSKWLRKCFLWSTKYAQFLHVGIFLDLLSLV